MIKLCDTCKRMIHNDDPIIILAASVFHEIPSKRMYAIDPPSECFEIHHGYCKPVKETDE